VTLFSADLALRVLGSGRLFPYARHRRIGDHFELGGPRGLGAGQLGEGRSRPGRLTRNLNARGGRTDLTRIFASETSALGGKFPSSPNDD